LSFTEREEIAVLHAQQVGVREIARRLGRAPSTISRELRRNAATRSGKLQYRATVAQWKSERAARRPKLAKLVLNDKLRAYVQERLAGTVMDVCGKRLLGPQVPWNGRRHGRRADRRWASSWSPEQISRRLQFEFPDDASMRISHEAIYQALYIQGRGALKRELTACLRTGRALRVPQARTRQRGRHFITPELMISERPAEIADRAIPGHWEGDLVFGNASSQIATLVERQTRYVMLVKLEGKDTQTVVNALIKNARKLPQELYKSLTWDRGTEMHGHKQFTMATDIQVYFCDPRSPWQRGSNENTNGLLRQYMPKGIDISGYSQAQLNAIARQLNERPRKTLGFQTPAEMFSESVASTR